MKKILSSVVMLSVIVLFGAQTASADFGYGGGGSSSSSGGQVSPAVMQSLGLVTTPSGKVLGASSFRFEISLKKGDSSDAVKELQERLRAEGYFTYATSTGFFGPITMKAVKAYQKANKLPQTGLVGSMTRAVLNK